MRKCHNCKNGVVDGGFNRRVNNETADLERVRNSRIAQLSRKDKQKYNLQKKKLWDHFGALLRKKSRETARTGTCLYCRGTGLR